MDCGDDSAGNLLADIAARLDLSGLTTCTGALIFMGPRHTLAPHHPELVWRLPQELSDSIGLQHERRITVSVCQNQVTICFLET